MTGEPTVAFVVFVRKRMPEIQYLRATISDEQRHEFGMLVANTVEQIESGSFLPHSGIRSNVVVAGLIRDEVRSCSTPTWYGRFAAR